MRAIGIFLYMLICKMKRFDYISIKSGKLVTNVQILLKTDMNSKTIQIQHLLPYGETKQIL